MRGTAATGARSGSHGPRPGRRAALATAVVVLVAAVGAYVAVAARFDPSMTAVSGHGLAMEFPSGWDARIYRQSPDHAVTVEGASVPLEPIADHAPQRTERRLDSEDLYVRLTDIGSPPAHLGSEPGWKRASAIRLTPSNVHRYVEGHSVPASAVGAFALGDHAIMVYVGFGSRPTDADLEDVNRILGTLSISERGP